MAERKWRAVNSALFLRTHPRVCGENGGVNLQTIETDGSSPRVRGKPHADYSAAARDRLIPACAGKTAASLPITRSSQAHPRVCGENDATDKFQNTLKGSSPRVRGKLWAYTVEHLLVRLIPTCAGKTSARAWPLGLLRAHPRVCGENFEIKPEMGRGEGSSPRVRGKRKIVIPDNTFFRLIPACAGKTQRRPSFCRPGRAHPRAGGENALGGQYVFGDMGSSPRWRGKLLDACENVANRGLIPALAGKTCFIVCAPFTLGAHPRAGGENFGDG